MTFVPHLKLTFSGTIKDVEMFACSLSLVPDGDGWTDLVPAIDQVQFLVDQLLDADATIFDDIVDDVVAYWTRATTNTCGLSKLKQVKLAAIDEDGHYAGTPRIAEMSVDPFADVTGFPWQISRKITLLTDGDLGRVKGGWFMPTPDAAGWDINTNQWSAAAVGEVQGSTSTFIGDLNNAPGLDGLGVDGLHVVVASQGRHNPDGSLRRPPTNHTVTGVNVGRRLDVQRRRANKVSEQRINDSSIE